MKKWGSTWIKLWMILFVWVFFFKLYEVDIQQVVTNNSLSSFEKVGEVSRIILGLPRGQGLQEVLPFEEGDLASPSSPQQVSEDVRSSLAYQKSLATANAFNQDLDLASLNQAFSDQVNQVRLGNGWELIQVDEALSVGTLLRAEELDQYHYFGSQTADGSEFRSLHLLENTGSLSEVIFEVYISTGDIHLTTWAQYPNILADYLMQVLPSLVVEANYAQINNQYLVARAAPTYMTSHGQAYVRLIFVVTLH